MKTGSSRQWCWMAAVSVAAPLLLGAASVSAADARFASVNAQAGVAPILTLVCNDIDFGAWRVQVRDDSETEVDLDESDNTTLSQNTKGVSKSSVSSLTTAGKCVLTGSQVANGHKIGVTLLSSTNVSFEGSARNYLRRPSSDAPLKANFAAPIKVTVNAGQATFKVSGALTIPGKINMDHYGGYSSIAPIQVQVVDVALD